MLIEDKFFSADKNYLLKTVQAFSKEMLIRSWAQEAFKSFNEIENPLGLRDSFYVKLENQILNGRFILSGSYDILAAWFRYKYGSNQLAFLWDGRSHMEFYDAEWKEYFQSIIAKITSDPAIYKSIVRAAISDASTDVTFVEQHIKRSLLGHLNIRMTRANKLRVLSA